METGARLRIRKARPERADRDGKVFGHQAVRWRERPVVEVSQAVVGAVGVDERIDVLECPIELSGSDNEVHGGIVSGPGDTPARAHLASTRTPRFLPVACHHGPAPFRAFVQVEGDPPRPRRRERPAGGPPTVFGPRHRKRARWLAKDPPPQARERAEAGTEPRAERHEGVTAPGAPHKRRPRRCREIAVGPRREWRGQTRRGVAIRPRRGGAQRPARGSCERGRAAEDGRRP